MNDIKNLHDLRLVKKRLRDEMRTSEKSHDNSFINKAVNMAFNVKNDASFTSSKVEESLNWLGNRASNKFPMKGFSKLLISGLIIVAVPIITNKIQQYIEEKF